MRDLTITLSLGMSKVGLSPQARLVNPDGTVAEADAGGTFADRGLGLYLWSGQVPAAFRGAVEFVHDGQVLAIAAVGPPDKDGYTLAFEQDYNNTGQAKYLPVSKVGYKLDQAEHAAIGEAVWAHEIDLEEDGGSTANDTSPMAALRRVWRRFFRPARKTADALHLESNDGATVSTQPISDDGEGNETQGMAS